MGCQSHVVDVGCWNHIIRHRNRFIPEAEVIDSVGTHRHGKETLAVSTFNAHDKQVFALPLDGAGIQRCIHHDALHQIRIVFLVEVIAPFQRRMLSGENRVGILCIDTVPPFQWFVFLSQQLLMVCTQGCHFCIKITHVNLFYIV